MHKRYHPPASSVKDRPLKLNKGKTLGTQQINRLFQAFSDQTSTRKAQRITAAVKEFIDFDRHPAHLRGLASSTLVAFADEMSSHLQLPLSGCAGKTAQEHPFPEGYSRTEFFTPASADTAVRTREDANRERISYSPALETVDIAVCRPSSPLF